MRVPVLPVRDTVHFPGVIQTLLVGRDMSLRALQESARAGENVFDALVAFRSSFRVPIPGILAERIGR